MIEQLSAPATPQEHLPPEHREAARDADSTALDHHRATITAPTEKRSAGIVTRTARSARN
jgi:hypothetical protein